MKANKILLGLVASALFVVGCDKNELPKFDDSFAFVAFTSSSASINEVKTVTEKIDGKDSTYNVQDSLVIEVLCSSLSGVTASVEFEITAPEVIVDSIKKTIMLPDSTTKDTVIVKITDKAAKKDIHYSYYTTCGNDSVLSFDKENVSQKIIIKPIDNGTFDGDKSFTITLKNVQGADLGTSKSCDITIVDDEHPLAFILGPKTASGESLCDGPEDWAVNVLKDPEGDVTKVFINNFIPATSSYSNLYGFVNDEKTELSVPACQVLEGNYYLKIRIFMEYDDDLNIDDELETGENLVATIDADGTITFPDVFIWVQAYKDKDLTDLAGNWEVLYGPIVIK